MQYVVASILEKFCRFLLWGILGLLLAAILVGLKPSVCAALTPEEALNSAVKRKMQTVHKQKRNVVKAQKPAVRVTHTHRRSTVTYSRPIKARVYRVTTYARYTRNTYSTPSHATAKPVKTAEKPVQGVREEPPVAATIWP